MDAEQNGGIQGFAYGHGGGNHPYVFCPCPKRDPIWVLDLVAKAEALAHNKHGELTKIKPAVLAYLAALAETDSKFERKIRSAQTEYDAATNEAEQELMKAIIAS